ncbi:hypothetical protein Z517_00742 [Fonsecaea pedrosoi CBS 271.37]|uniref:Ankyrin repeat protein n=1 Tax=Fonsecaea pedrosoi CBS 271.37 TaxID=1442368 RepID=A0A0D2FFB6_9EURO|nr:uncharacterized protein Z517_00742 [Fonsecaea pedrosoi CBS 271.37]KIW85352.1 hypothetical protein Z517_00742 [Fonsecaea pedrosoi CBS 271.37]
MDQYERMKFAVRNDEFMEVLDLLNEGAKPTMTDFVQAIQNKSFPILELFLNDGFDINKQVRGDYPPPLSYALDDMETTKWMIAHGALPNARCETGNTEYLFDAGASVKFGQPLHFAVRHQRPQATIQLLLNKGASINQVMFSNHSASYLQFECLGVGAPLHEAAKSKNKGLIKLLLANGADPSIPDSRGKLPEL